MTTATTAATATTEAAAIGGSVASTRKIRRSRRRIRNKTCNRCGIERRTMYTRQEQSSPFAWAKPYQDLCPNCYLFLEGEE